ncbi:hypothetical protein SUGI_0594550 [Cryptomeria japonica]|nr:hypothetical protein SUGI_0594550 [Cryptomeria japonica]
MKSSTWAFGAEQFENKDDGARKKQQRILPDGYKALCYTNSRGQCLDRICSKRRTTNLYLTNQFKFLNKAAIIKKEDFEENGSEPSPWKLCTVKKIQELKSVINVLPIWSTGIVASFILMGTSHTYMVYQAQHMNRNLGSLKVPASSYSIFSMLATSISLPFHDRILPSFFCRLRKKSEGISVMERIGIGLIVSVQAMTVAALVEVKRKRSSKISAFWLAPQYTLIGLAEAFYAIGLIEFFYDQFPKNLTSTAGALILCGMGIGLLLNSVVFTLVHKFTGKNGKKAWLPQDLDQGHLEYYFCFSAGLGVLNFLYFLVCAKGVKNRDSWEENKGGKMVPSA